MQTSLSVEETPPQADVDSLLNILIQFNDSKAGESNYQKLYILVRDNDNNVVGGVDAETLFGWLYIKRIAVADSLRHKGLGSKLLAAAEEEASKRGCKAVYLDTFSFQALPFYKKHGYEIFGTLPEFPPGHKRIFLWKKI